MQVRAEAYNFFNHSNLYMQLAETDLSVFDLDDPAPAFVPLKRGTGQRLTDERRNLQLALRFEF